MLRPLLAAALLAVLALPVGASGSPIVPQLTANVTATSITLVGANGKRVRVLQPNMYRIVVHDRTVKQNFHLVGPRREPQDEDRREDDQDLVASTCSPARTATVPTGTRGCRGAFIVAGSPPA